MKRHQMYNLLIGAVMYSRLKEDVKAELIEFIMELEENDKEKLQQEREDMILK